MAEASWRSVLGLVYVTIVPRPKNTYQIDRFFVAHEFFKLKRPENLVTSAEKPYSIRIITPKLSYANTKLPG